MLALGLSSKREIARTRVQTAMAAQTLEQGRYLGGRPPRGYRLGDAGPHPNRARRGLGAARTSWSPIRRRRRSSRGSSRSGWPGTAPSGRVLVMAHDRGEQVARQAVPG